MRQLLGALKTEQNLDDTNITSVPDCPELTEWDKYIVSECRFWISGVMVSSVGVLGMILNSIAIFMLSSRAANRIFFNKLLISLLTFDSIYLLVELIETFRVNFRLVTQINTLLYPYLLRPLTKVSRTASIFMTIAIAYERYLAIKRPIVHRQSLTSRRFRRRNLMKYIVCVISWSLMLNVPAWFESEIKWETTHPIIADNTTER